MKKLFFTIVFVCVLLSAKSYIAEAPRIPLTPKQQLVKSIVEKFPEQPEIMVAIALAESGLNPQAKNYNCYYKGYWKGKKPIITGSVQTKKGKGIISWSCKKVDEKYAWSFDSGAFQINNPTKEQITVEGNIEEARRRYEKQGKSAWTVYRLGKYKAKLAEAKQLVASIY